MTELNDTMNHRTKLPNNQVESTENFVKRNKKTLTVLSITAILAILLFSIVHDTTQEKLEARQEICNKLRSEGLPEIGEIFYGPGPVLIGDYSVRELYKLADILKDKKIGHYELGRLLSLKFKKNSDADMLRCVYSFKIMIPLGELYSPGSRGKEEYYSPTRSEISTKQSANEEEVNHPNWMIGSWRMKLDDATVLMVNLMYPDANIKIMRGTELMDSEHFENWTAENGILYMYNGNNKHSGAKCTYNAEQRVVFHKGSKMENIL